MNILEQTSVKFVVGADGVQVRREKGSAQSSRGTDGQQMEHQRADGWQSHQRKQPLENLSNTLFTRNVVFWITERVRF